MRKILALSLLLVTGTSFAGPQIVAHRGGTADAPENTVQAIKLALENQAQAVWITVQLSKDGVPVLYRPSDLKALTNKQAKSRTTRLRSYRQLTLAGAGAVKPIRGVAKG